MSALRQLGRMLFWKDGQPSKTSLLLVLTWAVLVGLLLAGVRAEVVEQGIELLLVVGGLYVGNHGLSGLLRERRLRRSGWGEDPLDDPAAPSGPPRRSPGSPRGDDA